MVIADEIAMECAGKLLRDKLQKVGADVLTVHFNGQSSLKRLRE